MCLTTDELQLCCSLTLDEIWFSPFAVIFWRFCRKSTREDSSKTSKSKRDEDGWSKISQGVRWDTAKCHLFMFLYKSSSYYLTFMQQQEFSRNLICFNSLPPCKQGWEEGREVLCSALSLWRWEKHGEAPSPAFEHGSCCAMGRNSSSSASVLCMMESEFPEQYNYRWLLVL